MSGGALSLVRQKYTPNLKMNTYTTSQILKDAIIMFLKDVSSAYFFIKNIVKTLKIK